MPVKALHSAGEEAVAAQDIQFDPRKVSRILGAVQPPPKALPPEESRITVHGVVSRISVLYEKLRNAVEYREEHLLRKGAIIRILKRQFILEGDPYVIAHNLIRELIAARYLPNEELSEILIDDAAMVIRKYQAIASVNVGGEKHLRWVLGVVASELEEVLAEPVVEKALITFLYERLSGAIHVRGVEMDDMERRLQIYVACYRTFIKADEEQASYKLLRAYLPEWTQPETWVDTPAHIAEQLIGVHERVQFQMKSRLTQRFIRAVRPWSVTLWMLQDALQGDEDPAMLLSSREELHAAVANVVEKREKRARGKIWRGTIRAMIYLFVTKILFALAIEVPIEWWIYGEVSKVALGINIGLPPAIMLMVGVFIKRPGVANRRRILEHVDTLLASHEPARQEVRNPKKTGGFTGFFFGLLYLIMFGISFGVIGYVLWEVLHFTPVAIVVFFFFLSLVSFFGYRLRSTAREIIVVKPKERLLLALGDFLALPILRAGQWLSTSISRINVVAFILDVVFEAPLKLFLGVMEESLKFIREKKEELSE